MKISQHSLQKVSKHTVSTDQIGQRIDNFLVKHLKKVPKSKIYKIIRKGELRVNKKRVKPDYKLKEKDEIRLPPIHIETSQHEEVYIPEKVIQLIKQSILFENEYFFVINKPYGIAVHAGSGLAYGIVDILKRARPNQTIELVHRLDRDTSGCLMIAKSRQSLLVLQNLLKTNQITKTYIAKVHGQWKYKIKKIEFPLLKYYMPNGEKRVKVDEKGKSALSVIKSVEIFKKTSLVKLQLVTGRMHQIRVHLSYLGYPILFDKKYGDREFDKKVQQKHEKRMMLHAQELTINENELCEAVTISAKVGDF